MAQPATNTPASGPYGIPANKAYGASAAVPAASATAPAGYSYDPSKSASDRIKAGEYVTESEWMSIYGPQVGDDSARKMYQQWINAANQYWGMESTKNNFNATASDIAKKLAAVPGNPNMGLVNRYYDEMSAPIEGSFYDQASNVSSYLARQGLGSSGINVAAHSGLAQNKAALEGQAKNKAMDLAIQTERQSLLDQLTASAIPMQFELQKYGIDVSKIIAQMQIDADMEKLNTGFMEKIMGSVGAGIGAYVGGPAGAGVGKGIGSSVGGMEDDKKGGFE